MKTHLFSRNILSNSNFSTNCSCRHHYNSLHFVKDLYDHANKIRKIVYLTNIYYVVDNYDWLVRSYDKIKKRRNDCENQKF